MALSGGLNLEGLGLSLETLQAAGLMDLLGAVGTSPGGLQGALGSFGPVKQDVGDNRYSPYGSSPSQNNEGVKKNSLGHPLRPTTSPCNFYLKTGHCKFGMECKWDHPEGQGGAGGVHDGCPLTSGGLPVRPGFPLCAYYVKTGQCKFGSACKHDHPEDLNSVAMPAGLANASAMSMPMPVPGGSTDGVSRSAKMPCQFFLRTGSCKFGAACVWDHSAAASFPSSSGAMGFASQPGQSDLASSMVLTGQNPLYGQQMGHFDQQLGGVLGQPEQQFQVSAGGLPLRPGQQPCGFYMKTGQCKFGLSCKWDHPVGVGGSTQPAPDFPPPQPDGSPLNHKGLPMRPGAPPCIFFIKTGECKFGAACKHDHPNE